MRRSISTPRDGIWRFRALRLLEETVELQEFSVEKTRRDNRDTDVGTKRMSTFSPLEETPLASMIGR